MQKRIILGSASPRRRELMEQIGLTFEVRVSGKEEVYTSTDPVDIVRELACMKAKNVASELTDEERKETAVIGADTIVVQDGTILGKPVDEEDAVRMLGTLQGRCHEVYTGTALIFYDESGGSMMLNRSCGTKVYVYEMSEAEIRAYVATGEPMDKAGGYGIQGRFAAYIDHIEGDYYNVVGLPVSDIYQALKVNHWIEPD